ncbi:MAG: hypothetical protein IK083_08420 [Abditibacteriota bacterium]|nr:hypothetical protein [Abditibacteriota bacterium]
MNKALWVLLILMSVTAVFAAPSDLIVTDFGAKGDGRTDCTEAFQKALDAAFEAGGGNVQVPTGIYDVRGNLVIRSGVFLVGTYQAGPTERFDGKPEDVMGQGSLLRAYAGRNKPEDKPFIELVGSNNGVKGLVIYYPEIDYMDAPPVPYPPCIAGYTGDNQNVIDVMLWNAYEGIRLVGVGRSFISKVYGYPSKRGLYIDKCYDISRVENCHFWPFGNTGSKNPAYGEWINQNGVAFEFARTDWQYVFNCFCFGYGVGYKFSQSDAGACNGNFLGLGADSCAAGVLVEAAQAPGLLITNGEFVGRWRSHDSVGVDVAPDTTGKVSLSNCAFWGPLCYGVRNAGANHLSVIGCHFENFGTAAINVEKGDAIVQGNTFQAGPKHLILDEGVKEAIVNANIASERLIIDNRIGSKAQVALNTPDPEASLTAAQKDCYTVNVGEPGDEPFVTGVHGKERVKRWTSDKAVLLLPVNKNKKVTVTLELAELPESALANDAGVYLEGKKLAGITKSGPQTLSFTVNTGNGEMLKPELRVKGWFSESGDHRLLGAGLARITVSAGKGTPFVVNPPAKKDDK